MANLDSRASAARRQEHEVVAVNHLVAVGEP
jgi:hypothetical protein